MAAAFVVKTGLTRKPTTNAAAQFLVAADISRATTARCTAHASAVAGTLRATEGGFGVPAHLPRWAAHFAAVSEACGAAERPAWISALISGFAAAKPTRRRLFGAAGVMVALAYVGATTDIAADDPTGRAARSRRVRAGLVLITAEMIALNWAARATTLVAPVEADCADSRTGDETEFDTNAITKERQGASACHAGVAENNVLGAVVGAVLAPVAANWSADSSAA
jgi:hypothetical protein